MPTTHELLDCFFTHGQEEFSFLEQKHGYKCIAGIVQNIKGREVILPYKKESSSLNHLAKVIYEQDEVTIELGYCTENTAITALLHCQEWFCIGRLSVNFMPPGEPAYVPKDNSYVVENSSKLKVSLTALATMLCPNMYLMTPWAKQARSNIIKKTIAYREQVLVDAIRQQYKRGFEYACEQAAQAFLDRDYKRVIVLLTPYERDLSMPDRKRLELATKKILTPILDS